MILLVLAGASLQPLQKMKVRVLAIRTYEILTFLDQLHTLLENSLKIFGDTFYIKHTPLLQQQCNFSI